jgi:hypothetical protein
VETACEARANRVRRPWKSRGNRVEIACDDRGNRVRSAWKSRATTVEIACEARGNRVRRSVRTACEARAKRVRSAWKSRATTVEIAWKWRGDFLWAMPSSCFLHPILGGPFGWDSIPDCVRSGAFRSSCDGPQDIRSRAVLACGILMVSCRPVSVPRGSGCCAYSGPAWAVAVV